MGAHMGVSENYAHYEESQNSDYALLGPIKGSIYVWRLPHSPVLKRHNNSTFGGQVFDGA